jgi:hypothetical protein
VSTIRRESDVLALNVTDQFMTDTLALGRRLSTIAKPASWRGRAQIIFSEPTSGNNHVFSSPATEIFIERCDKVCAAGQKAQI